MVSGKDVVYIIMFVSLIILLIFILITSLISSELPTCPGRVSNLVTKTSRTGSNITYTPGIEVCHSNNKCNNPLAQCIYYPYLGTICPSDASYTDGSIPPGDEYACLTKTTCPIWSSIGFDQYSGFFLQTQDNPTICGVNNGFEGDIWPQNCILGRLVLNLDDNRYYCTNNQTDCNGTLKTSWNAQLKVSEFSC